MKGIPPNRITSLLRLRFLCVLRVKTERPNPFPSPFGLAPFRVAQGRQGSLENRPKTGTLMPCSRA
jgi:hypothetical protein